MNDIEKQAMALAIHMLATMKTEDLDDMLIREGYSEAAKCLKCERETLWPPGQADTCICNACAGTR